MAKRPFSQVATGVCARFLALTALIAFAGCSTHRSFEPNFSAQERPGLDPEEPLLVAVLDGRTTAESETADDPATTLLRDLQSIYTDGVEEHPYFSEIPEGRVGLKIRIRALGANFGSRVITQAAARELASEANVTGSIGFKGLAASVTEKQTLLTSSMVGEGWWVGTAWLDLTIVDRRSESGRVEFPLVAEVKKQNTFGYSSAEDATQEAWRSVSSTLLYVMDKIISTLQ